MAAMALLPAKVDYLQELENRAREETAAGPEDECQICMDPFSATHWPIRSHHESDRLHGDKCVFGASCLSTWAAENRTCPLCRGHLYGRPVSSEPQGADSEAMDLDSDLDFLVDQPVVNTPRQDDLPALRSAVQSASSTDVTVILEQRERAYMARRGLVSYTRDYARYQRASPGMRYLPCWSFPLAAADLVERLTRRYMDDLSAGWTDSEGLAPVAAHPLAYVLLTTIIGAIRSRRCFVPNSTAPELEQWIVDIVTTHTNDNGNFVFWDLALRSQFVGENNLPLGLAAWARDMIDVVLAAHVGPVVAKGPVAGSDWKLVRTYNVIKARGWYEIRRDIRWEI